MAVFFVATTLLTLVAMALLTGIELGLVPVPLPCPPALKGEAMMPPPPGLLPITYDHGFAPNSTDLKSAKLLFSGDESGKGAIVGVETVAVAPNGSLGLVDRLGQVFLADPDGAGGFTTPKYLTKIAPGRSLGARFDVAGNLLVCNGPLGLVMLTDGAAETDGAPRQVLLTARVSAASPLAAGRPVEFANSLDIARDGSVYFSHSTDLAPFRMPDGSWNPLDSVFVALGQSAPSGMLLRYDPPTRQTTALFRGLLYANGVALSHSENFVVVADSIQAKLFRHWLKGPSAGTTDVFASNLPGPPDGVSRASDGGFWVTFFTRFPPLMKFTESRLVRAAFAWTPPALRPKLQKVGLVIKYSARGEFEFEFADPNGEVVSGVTSAIEAPDGRLWLGGLHGRGVHYLELAAPLAARAARGGAAGAAAAGLLRSVEARRAAAAAERDAARRADAAAAAAAAGSGKQEEEEQEATLEAAGAVGDDGAGAPGAGAEQEPAPQDGSVAGEGAAAAEGEQERSEL